MIILAYAPDARGPEDFGLAEALATWDARWIAVGTRSVVAAARHSSTLTVWDVVTTDKVTCGTTEALFPWLALS